MISHHVQRTYGELAYCAWRPGESMDSGPRILGRAFEKRLPKEGGPVERAIGDRRTPTIGSLGTRWSRAEDTRASVRSDQVALGSQPSGASSNPSNENDGTTMQPGRAPSAAGARQVSAYQPPSG